MKTKHCMLDQKKNWRHDIQYNNTQHNDIQHKGLIQDTQHK